MRRTVFVAWDQLNRTRGALRGAHPSTHEVLMVESDRMVRGRSWHAQRLHFLMASAARFREELRAEGFPVHLVQAPTLRAGLELHREGRPGVELVAAEPSGFRMLGVLRGAGVRLVPSDLFLTSRDEFARWAEGRRSLVMENFYRWQRTRLGVLMEGGKPVGGRWNLDAENRLPPPRDPHPWPAPLKHGADELDRRVWEEIRSRELPVVGSPPDGTWGTSRAAALRQLRHFLDHAFADFGPYEDAMPADTWSVNHSLLAPYLNAGLLHADEVVRAAVERFEEGGVPLASAEGFLRQVIGWREYVHGTYWFFGREYEKVNALGAHRPLPPVYGDPSRTRMACMRSVVGDVFARAWVHHIPRLMVLSNLALLAGVNPQAYLDWMRRLFVDAADWVMVPNVLGMGLHADGGRMMTRPYAGGGAYLSRMGRYCSGCAYDPKLRTGERACPFTTLYWAFLDRHREAFARNVRMAQQVRGLDRLADLPAVRERAARVLEELDQGRL